MRATTLRMLIAAAAVIGLATLLGAPAFAQRATEQFIPIGQSPGVSGVTSEIGVVTMVDESVGVMAIEVEGREHLFAMTPHTEVWLDRSDAHRSNLEVGYGGLRLGDMVEVNREIVSLAARAESARFAGAAMPIADWIKIEASARQ